MRDPDPQILRILTELARQEDQTGRASLGQAARRLGLVQPNVSRSLKRFEAEAGVRILQRSPGGSRLTADGRTLVTWAEPIVAGYDRMGASLTALRNRAAARLRIAASLTVAEYVLPAHLLTFRRTHPEVRLALEMVNSAGVLDQVRAQRVELGFIETAGRPQGVRYRTFAHDDVVIAALPDHPAAAGRRLGGEDLADIPLLVRELGSGTRQAIDKAVPGGANVAAELTSSSAIKTALATGVAPAAISRLAVREQLAAGTFVALPVEPTVAARLYRSLRVVWGKHVEPRGPAADFVSMVTVGAR